MKNHSIYISIILILIFFYYWSWEDNKHNTTKPPEVPSTDTIASISKKCPEGLDLQAIEKERIKNKLFEQSLYDKIAELYSNQNNTKLPDWFTDEDTIFLADKTLPSHRAETYVASTLNLKTGKGGITYKQKDIPLFGFENKATIGLGYIGLGDKAGSLLLQATYTPFRFGNWYLTGFGQLDTNFRAGLIANYTF